MLKEETFTRNIKKKGLVGRIRDASPTNMQFNSFLKYISIQSAGAALLLDREVLLLNPAAAVEVKALTEAVPPEFSRGVVEELDLDDAAKVQF